jgi:uncharacterized membrane protein YkvA (DUF1232 family)
MHWFGALVLFAGAVLTFAIRGHLTDAGIVTMIVGALLLVAGVVRLNRGRRATRRSATAAAQEQVYRTSKGKMIAMIAAVVYILSPIDLVPDVLLPVGVIDDATAFSWLMIAIAQEVVRRRRSLT